VGEVGRVGAKGCPIASWELCSLQCCGSMTQLQSPSRSAHSRAAALLSETNGGGPEADHGAFLVSCESHYSIQVQANTHIR